MKSRSKALLKETILTKKPVKEFIDSCFSDLIKELHITDYQARASQTGKMFEHAFWFLMKKKFNVELDRDHELPKACMERGGALDFGIIRHGEVLCGIEAKGSDTTASVRPALVRTDTVKKAISQAYQFKRIYPNIPFYLVTNAKPTQGNAKCMLALAEGDIIDKVIDITDKKELEFFVGKIRELL